MLHFLRALSAAAMVVAGLASAPAVRAADYVIQDSGGYGACAEQKYLSRISSRFDHQVKNVPHLPDVSILEFVNIHERRYLPETEEWPISRRYCAATVVLSDGHTRDIWYLIEGRMGLAGIGDNVEFCVSGFDRWFVYNGRCRILR